MQGLQKNQRSFVDGVFLCFHLVRKLVCQRERERYNADDIVDDLAYIAIAANVDASISDIDSATIAAANVDDAPDVSLIDNTDVVDANGAARPNAHLKRNRPRSPYRVNNKSLQMLCPFSSSSSFLLDLAIIQRLR